MSDLSQKDHPLTRDGSSQTQRKLAALGTDYVQVDERSTEDVLKFLYDFSASVQHYDENLEVSDWVDFFRQSTPFQIARMSKFDAEATLVDFREKTNKLTEENNLQYIAPIIDRIIELAEQIDDWYNGIREDFGFRALIANAIETNLSASLKELVSLINATKVRFPQYRESLNLETFRKNHIWRFNIADKLKIDQPFLQIKGGPKAYYQNLGIRLDEIFETFFQVTQQIVVDAPRQLEESFKDHEKHEPHIGLMITFLRLFEKVRGNFNQFTEEHLDFFYRDVLQLKEKESIPDSAHLVFQAAKQINQFKIDQGISFDGGKDGSGAELTYNSAEELILNKTSVADLRTLYLQPCIIPASKSAPVTPEKRLVDGVFIAPNAPMMDGIELPFDEETIPAWSTLGSLKSKFRDEQNQSSFVDHPNGVLGFILSSNILLLKEGNRTITITLSLHPDSIDDNHYSNFKEALGKQVYIVRASNIDAIKKEGIDPQLIEYFASVIGKKMTEKEYKTFLKDAVFLKDIDLPATIKNIDVANLKDIYHQEEPVFKIEFTGEEGWFNSALSPIEFKKDLSATNPAFLKLVVNLPESELPILNSNKEIHGDFGLNKLPAVKISLQHNTNIKIDQTVPDNCASLYHFFRQIKITDVDILTEVTGVKDVVIQSNEGVLDINKPFQPFGTIPKVGAEFFIGSREIFQKEITKLKIDITWDGLPEATFAKHYEGYVPPNELPIASDYKVKVEHLKEKKWNPLLNNVALFSENGTISPAIKLNIGGIEPTNIDDAITEYSVNSENGFVKLTLTPEDFWHDEYGPALGRQMLAAGKLPNELVGGAVYYQGGSFVSTETVRNSISNMITTIHNNGTLATIHSNLHSASGVLNNFFNKNHRVPIPKEPYTPTIKKIDIGYCATADKDSIQFTHLFPFENTYLQRGYDTELTILPDHQNEGTLFIGLQDCISGSIVSLLFQLVESTANPDIPAADIKWHYLKDNRWEPLRLDEEILSDSTNGLINSGIVKIALPRTINKNNTILPKELHWIKVATLTNADAVAESIQAHAQAVKVVFENQNNDLARLATPLPAGTIAKPILETAAIEETLQPYESFGGRAVESKTDYYTRVSEHLRHKGRAITLFDYEKIVLQNFPNIYKVKCITHTLGNKGAIKDYKISPGYVTLAVIPDVSKLTYAGRFQPKTTLATLKAIERYLSSRISPFVRLQVMNPRYESFNISFKAKFIKGKSETFYQKTLEEDIRKFLAPWAFGEQERISFGGKVYASTILRFIEEQDYIDYITDFEMRKLLSDPGVNELSGTSPRSILVLENLDIKTLDECSSSNGVDKSTLFIVGHTELAE